MKELRERSWITKKAGLVCVLLLLAAFGAYAAFTHSPPGLEAQVERAGEIVLRQELSLLDGPREATVEGENGLTVTVTFYPDGAAVTEAACPDRVCVRTGKLTRAGETALCLPAKICLRLTGGPGVDETTY